MSPSSRWSLGHIYTPHRPPLHPPLPPPRLFHLPSKAQSQVLHAFPSLILCFHMIFLLVEEKAPSVSASILFCRFYSTHSASLCVLFAVSVCVSHSSVTTSNSISTVSSIAIKKRCHPSASLAQPTHFISLQPIQSRMQTSTLVPVFMCPMALFQPLDGDTLPPLRCTFEMVNV